MFKRDNILNFWVVRPGIINVIFSVKSTVGRMITPKSYFKATVIKTVVCNERTDKRSMKGKAPRNCLCIRLALQGSKDNTME